MRARPSTTSSSPKARSTTRCTAGTVDVEREAVELLLASDVLDGLVREAAENEAVVAGLLMGSERAVAVGVQRGARDSERVEKQQERVAVGVCAKIWRRVDRK